MKIVYAAATIIINENNDILIAKRKDDQIYSGYWEFPGGKLEKNETPADAAIREVKEEIGITIEQIQPFTFISQTRNPEDKEKYHIIVYIFISRKWQGSACGIENQEIKWINIDQLEDHKLLPANIPLIPQIRTSLKS